MVCERCPAVWLVTKTISVLALRQQDKQDVKEMNSHHTVLNSTKGYKPYLTLACSFSKAVMPLGHPSAANERSYETKNKCASLNS